MVSAASKKLLKHLPSPEEMTQHLKDLLNDNDQAVALVGGAYLDATLETLLTSHFRVLPKEDEDRLFNSTTGILSSMAAKARLAYALRFIEKQQYEDIMLITQIRNAFAHTLHRVSFSNPLIKADCDALRTLNPKVDGLDALEPKHKFLFVMVSLSAEMAKVMRKQTLATFLEAQASGRVGTPQPSPDKSPGQSPHKARRGRARNKRRSQRQS